MKKRWILVFLTLLAAVLALTACGTEVNDGNIDVPDEVLDQLPFIVEVTGLEGVSGVGKADLLDDQAYAAALSAVKDVYYVADDAVVYAADIKIVDESGKEIVVGKPVSVTITMKDENWFLVHNYEIFHVHDGIASMLDITVDGNKATFTVDSFSPFVLVPVHEHAYGEWTFVGEEPACGEAGIQKRVCVCGDEQTRDYTVDHVDAGGDGICDKCGTKIKGTETSDTGLEGKVFTFDRAEGEGINPSTYATAYADTTMSFFADNYMEYHVYKSVRGGVVSNSDVALCGNFALNKDGTVITLTVTKRYYDDEETMIPFPTYTYGYDKNTATVTVTEIGDTGSEITLFFTVDANATPTKYTPPALPDNWDGSVIIAAFNALGAEKEYTLPKLEGVLSMSKSNVDMGKVDVTVVMASKMQGGTAVNAYKELLESTYYDYAWPTEGDNIETRLNTDDNLFWFKVSTGNEDGYTVMTITISRFEPAYPDAGINNFLTDNGMTDEVIEFTTPWAMKYRFVTDEIASPGLAYIYVGLRYQKNVERHDADVATSFRNSLCSEFGYEERTVGGKTFLCSENDQIALRIVISEAGDEVYIYINDYSIFYPAEAIAAYLAGTDDEFIDLDDDTVFGYELFTNEADNPTALHLVGKLPATVDANLIITGFQSEFAEAGYKWGGFATHFGSEDAETLYHHAWISPDREIAVMFEAFNIGEHESGDMAYYSVSIVNLTAIAANNKSIMTSLSAAGYSPSVKLGGTYTFDGGIAYLYTNMGTGLEGGGMYTYDYSLVNVGTIDTSEPGEQTLRISLKGNDDIYTEIPILVWSLTSIEATTTKTKIDGRVAYYSANWKYESEYNIIRHYSDGSTTTVKGNDESVTFGDIDGSKAKQDLAISCTVEGVTVSTSVAIGLFKAVNYTCTDSWDISADNAQFALYAVGGSYGDGAWVEFTYVELRRNTFASNVYIDATNIYFVRLSPDLNVFGEVEYDLDSDGVWNVSDSIDVSNGSASGEFSFNVG